MVALVSTVIPTFDRKEDVVVAVASALAQTHAAQEVIVVDDGSRDGTAQRLRHDFGDAVKILRTERLGVSGARNHGMAAARGQYIALLDSDDEWAPEKLEAQVAYLEERPDYGMVLTDVDQMDRARKSIREVVLRRRAIPEDGPVFRHVLRQPALVPSSALFRRRVIDQVGGFDASLPTAEDIDFHLRVAHRFPIGVIEQALTRCMRDHEGLSAQARTYTDYMFVIHRFMLDHRHSIAASDRRLALREASLRNMRGMLTMGLLTGALGLGAELVTRSRNAEDLLPVARMAPALARATVRKLRGGFTDDRRPARSS